MASLFDINPNARFSFASILFGDPVSPNLQSSPSFQRHDLVTSAAGLGDDAGELLNLRLGAGEGSEALLGELTGTLVLGVAEEFNDAALIGSEASNLLDNVADESGALAQVTLGPADAGLGNASGGLVTAVKTDCEPGAGNLLGSSHLVC